MTPELYQRLKPLYDAALDIPREKRDAFVAEAYRRDRELGLELEALLKNHEAGGSSLDRPIVNLQELIPGQQAFAEGEVLLGQFKIVRHIKSGGMGQVYEATDLLLPKSRLALKTVLPSIAQDASVLARFKEEVTLARQVKGAHICPIYAIYASPVGPGRDSLAFFTMEFLEGITLADGIAAGLMPPKEAMRIALQLCEALRSIHEASVVHRDLKPNNIMLVSRNGVERAVVMDFGLARSMPADPGAAETGLTKPGMIMGNPGYMAPEQFEPGAKISPATDIYALGIVLYEMVTGRRPFPASTFQSAAMSRSRPPGLPSSIRRGLPAVWDDVISRCLENDPARRYQSADQIIEALHQHNLVIWRFSQGQRIALTPRIAVIAGAVLLVLLGVSVWSLYRTVTTYRPPQEAKRWYLDGVAALRDGTYLTAANSLAMAVKSDPRYALAHARLAEAWAELDSTGEAQQQMLLATAAEQQVSLRDEDKRYIDAVHHTLVRDYSAADQDYEEILKRLPGEEKADGLVDLGRAYEKAGKVKETIASYEQAAKLRPDDPAPFVHLGIWKSRQRDPAGAEASFTRAEELYRAKSNQEGLAEVAYQRGYAANESADSEHALAYLNESLSIARQIDSPQLEARSLTQMSSVKYHSNKDDEAIEDANRAIQIAHENGLEYWSTDGAMRLGNAYLEKGDFTRAEFYSQEALRLAEQNQHPRIEATAKFTLASIRYQQGGKWSEEIKLAKEALEYFKDFGFLDTAATASILIVGGEAGKGDLAQARKDGVELLRLAESAHSNLLIEYAENMVGSVSLEQEDYPEALNHFERALKVSRLLHDDEADQAIGCAAALWRLGRYSDAEAALNEIPDGVRKRTDISLNIDDTVAPMKLSQGKYREAIAISNKVLLNPTGISVAQIADFRQVRALAEGQLRQNRLAQSDADQLLKLGKDNSDDSIIAQAELVNAELLLAENQPRKVLPLLGAATQYFSKGGMKESEWRSYVLQAKAAKALGDTANSSENSAKALDILKNLEHSWGSLNFAQYASRPDCRADIQELSNIH